MLDSGGGSSGPDVVVFEALALVPIVSTGCSRLPLPSCCRSVVLARALSLSHTLSHTHVHSLAHTQPPHPSSHSRYLSLALSSPRSLPLSLCLSLSLSRCVSVCCPGFSGLTQRRKKACRNSTFGRDKEKRAPTTSDRQGLLLPPEERARQRSAAQQGCGRVGR